MTELSQEELRPPDSRTKAFSPLYPKGGTALLPLPLYAGPMHALKVFGMTEWILSAKAP